jgi:hypothetical protein
MTKKLLLLVGLTVALSAAVLLISAPTPTAEAGGGLSASACPNPGYYEGTSTSGSWQGALDDAIAAAETCAGCCDMLVTWDFVSADGREGGFVGHNEVNVTIKASW